MPIEDSNVERRNLVATSLAFIAYFYGGGSFKEGTVNLHVVNIAFAHTYFLACMSWSMLFWFFYRYYLLHSGSFTRGFASELNERHKAPEIALLLEKATNKPFLITRPPSEGEVGYVVTGLEWRRMRLLAYYDHAKSVHRNPDNQQIVSYTYAESTDRSRSAYKFPGLRGILYSIKYATPILLGQKSFSDYLVPYLLFATAVIGGLTQLVSNAIKNT